MFPLEKMLFALSVDEKSTKYVLEAIKPKIEQIREREAHARKEVINLGIKVSERLNLASSGGKDQEDDEYECQVCNANLFVSLIANEEEESTFCLEHGMEYARDNPQKVRGCKLMYTHTQEEIKEVLHSVIRRIQEGRYLDEHDEDPPITESDVQDIEDDDYVEEEDIKPRERALPSYIKKEKGPLISSESEDEDEDEEAEDEGPQITADDYLEDFPEEDIRVIEALFADDDEVVRKTSGKRKAPTVRNISESSDEEEDEDDGEGEKTDKPAGSRQKLSDNSPAAGKKKEDGRTKAAKAKEAEKRKKLLEKESAKQEMLKRQKEKEDLKKKRKREEAGGSNSKKRKEGEAGGSRKQKGKDETETEDEASSKGGRKQKTKEVKKEEQKKCAQKRMVEPRLPKPRRLRNGRSS